MVDPDHEPRTRVLAAAVLALACASQVGCVSETGDDSDDGAEAAVDQGRRHWSTEDGLENRFEKEILPYFKHAKEGEFAGANGVTIRYVKLLVPKQQEKAAIVLFPGRTESTVKYAEVGFDLNRAGYSLYIFDHRGQGFSDRLLKDPADHDKGHIDAFSNYVEDAKTFVDTVVAPAGHARTFALGHSLGGAILGQYLFERPNDFRAVVMTSPMLRIKFPWYVVNSEDGAEWIASHGPETSYPADQGPYKANAENIYSHSPIRYRIADGLNARFPEIKLGGPTNKWVLEAIRADQELRARAISLATPMLLVQATDDKVVETEPQTVACKAAKACELFRVNGAGHELLMEKDDFRIPTLDAIVRFVDGH